ncbi:protein sel-1 homolog 2-like isoform X2 [Macaca nemestrina]|uniref:protein sel-1 homolog 2-like isoform X2 n=1 Tax=Macaca nemestrina TaxID=9545 RepID=UPI0039B976FE
MGHFGFACPAVPCQEEEELHAGNLQMAWGCRSPRCGWWQLRRLQRAKTVSANEIKQYLPHILEQRTSSNVINKRENLLEEKKNQCKIKGIQNKDILRNKNHLQKQAEKNFTDEGDQLFKMGIKVLQQSKSQKQKEE